MADRLPFIDRLKMQLTTQAEETRHTNAVTFIEARQRYSGALTFADTPPDDFEDREKKLLTEIKTTAKAAKGFQSNVRTLLSVYEGRDAHLFESQDQPLHKGIEELRGDLLEIDPIVEAYAGLLDIQQDICDVAERREKLLKEREKVAARLADQRIEIDEARREVDAAPESKKNKLQKKYEEGTRKEAKSISEMARLTGDLEYLSQTFKILSDRRLVRHEAACALVFSEFDSTDSDDVIPEGAEPGDDIEESGALHDGVDNDVFSQLKKLAELHESGILTDEEFQSKKSELLSRI